MNTLTKEKQSVREYAIAEQKKYEFEKELQKSSTHIFLKKESEFTSVNRIINKFKKISSMEFDTIFKLYKFQNYSYSPQYLLGTSYKYGTLFCFITYVKAATKGLMSAGVNKPGYKTNSIIFDFIKEVKEFSSPFPYIFSENESKKKINALVESGTLSEEELTFVSNKLDHPYASTYDEICKPTSKQVNKYTSKQVTKETTMTKTSKRTKQFLTDADYKTIVKFYKKGAMHVAGMLPHMNKKTVSNYVRSCRLLEKNIVPNRTCPEQLIKYFNSFRGKDLVNSIIKTNEQLASSDRYIIMKDSEVILCDSNEMYVRGYYDCGKDISWKLYKMIEL